MQPTQPLTPEIPSETSCPDHDQTAKWTCAVCGKPLCSNCKPVAYNYKIFHRDCIDKLNREPEKKRARPTAMAVDAPSTGVRVVAWTFIVSAILWLGFGLLATGVSLASRHYVPIAASLGNPLAVLDEIPGSRGIVGWFAVIGLLGTVVQAWIGLGLLNCVPAARRTVLFLAWLEVVVAVPGWAVVLLAQQGFWDIPLIAVLLIIFFSRKDVKKQFQPTT